MTKKSLFNSIKSLQLLDWSEFNVFDDAPFEISAGFLILDIGGWSTCALLKNYKSMFCSLSYIFWICFNFLELRLSFFLIMRLLFLLENDPDVSYFTIWDYKLAFKSYVYTEFDLEKLLNWFWRQAHLFLCVTLLKSLPFSRVLSSSISLLELFSSFWIFISSWSWSFWVDEWLADLNTFLSLVYLESRRLWSSFWTMYPWNWSVIGKVTAISFLISLSLSFSLSSCKFEL